MAKLRQAKPPRINDSCKTMTDLIFDYLTDRLTSTLKREFEQHLKICPDCVSFLNTYRKTVALGGSVSVGAVPVKVRSNVLAFVRQKMHRIAVFFISLIAQATS